MWKIVKWVLATLWALLLALAMFILQRWISGEKLPNLPPLISLLAGNILVLILAFVLLGSLALIAFQQDSLKGLRDRVWSYASTKSLKPSDVNPSPAWFDPYFLERPAVAATVKSLLSANGVLLIGVPLAGKTRCAYEALKQLKGYHVLGLFPDELNIVDIKIPRSLFAFKPKVILLLDDLEKYVGKFVPSQLYQRVAKQSASLTILATCRSGDELTSVHADRDWRSFVSQQMKEVCVERLSKHEEKTLASHFNRGWAESSYDGTPGSIVFGLQEMQQRLRAASLGSRVLMRSLGIMRQAGLQAFRRLLAEEIAVKIFGLERSRVSTDDSWRWLNEAGYIGIEGEGVVPTHAVYLESSFLPENEIGDIKDTLAALWQMLLKRGRPLEIYGASLGSLQRDEFSLAELGFRNYLDFDPTSSVAHNSLGAALAGQHRLDEAVEEIFQAIRSQPDYSDAYYNLGWVLDELGREEEAKKAYDQAIQLDTTSAHAYTNLGTLLGKAGDLREAERLLRAALRLDQNAANAHANLAIVLRAQSRMLEAEQELRQAVRCDSADADLHFNLATLLAEVGSLEVSENEYREAVRLNPKDARIRRGLAWNLHKQGRIQDAEAEQREAVRCDPNDGETHYGLGVILGEQKRIEEAEEEYRKAVGCDPSHAESHYNLAIVVESKGVWIEAEEGYREAISHRPGHPSARLRLGSLLDKLGKEKEAEAEYREGIAKDPDFASFHHNLGLLLYEQDNNKEAEREFREAIRCNPLHVNAHKGLSRLLREQGRIEEAERIDQQAGRLPDQNGR